MEKTKEPRTLKPYELVVTDSDYSGHENFNNWSNWGNGPTDPGKVLRGESYERFNNWSNWGNGPTDPGKIPQGLEAIAQKFFK